MAVSFIGGEKKMYSINTFTRNRSKLL